MTEKPIIKSTVEVAKPLPYEGTEEQWKEDDEDNRSVRVGHWRVNKNYNCIRCLNSAYEHPYTHQIWGCKKCDFTTRELAMRFVKMEDPDAKQKQIVHRAEMLLSQPCADFFDFCICYHTRSGSHLLATLLNSHPEIACEGEVRPEGRDPNKGYSIVSWKAISASTGGILPPKGRIRGCLVPYIGIDHFLSHGYRPDRWIHLLRDPEKVALSTLRRWMQRTASKGDIDPHYTQKEREKGEIPLSFGREIDPEVLANITNTVTHSQETVAEFLEKMDDQGKIPYLYNLCYEEFTYEKEITYMPEGVSYHLLNFLNAKNREFMLTTPLVKTS